MKPYVLIIRQLGGIGDVLAASPVLRGVAEKYPDLERHVVTSAHYLAGALPPLMRHNRFVDRLHLIDPMHSTTERTVANQPRLCPGAARLEQEKIYRDAALVIDINNPCIEYEQAAMITVEGVRKPRYQIWCEAAGVTPSSYRPIYEIGRDERQWARNHWKSKGWDKKKVIGIGLAAVHAERAIPSQKLQDIATGLVARGFHPVTFDSHNKLEGVEYSIGLPIEQTIALMESLSCFVGADSGLLHVAGTLDVPIVGLFGPTDPAMRMGQYRGSATDSRQLVSCAHCWYLKPCLRERDERKHFACTSRIPVDLVVEETARWVEGAYT